MSTIATPPQGPARTGFLPGYRALEKLGSGGYGEVWKAEAPGGLVKAVKVLFGFSHEQRASDELKSLERVKQVRHPFLLSLERIETIESRLFIVTELADRSLKDCFNDYLGRGKNGIPRTELLKYLRDAADALDFMSEVHGLQHLDIKPENLLLVAGHIKVADFGLVKDVAGQSVSLVGGMTPIYAAPEVYHGRPSRYSDQYSLAVVFQQMLTAALPFAGASAAELTLQHLNEEPDLTSLPAQDRPAIARALSKNPDHRYASCRTLIDALIQGESARPSSSVSQSVAKRQHAPKADVDFGVTLDRSRHMGLADPKKGELPTANITLEFEEMEAPRVVMRRAPQVDPDAYQPIPTLVIGVGGTAGHVVRQFKRRLVDRFGDAAAIPAVKTLLIDTDASELLAATHGTMVGRLSTDETIPAPLRRPQEYRSRQGQPFRWLSRRWLYNIPRSLKTEGLRPLGRLAFVDHASPIRARLIDAIDAVLDGSAIKKSQAATGLPFGENALRVYLVASICGGTGSGMALDLAYMLGDLIGARDVAFDGVTGLLLLGDSGRPRARELAAVNAFAWLTEYNHFNRPGAAFPGDPSCGLEPRDVDHRAFDNAYVVRLGGGEFASDLDEQADGVAQYICLDALSPVQSFLQACRSQQESNDPPSRERAPLSTFGIAVQDVTRNREVDLASGELAQKVVVSWLGRQAEGPMTGTSADKLHAPSTETDQPSTVGVERACQAESGKLQLTAGELTALSAKLVELELAASPKAFYQRLVLELRGSREQVPLPAIVQAIDRMFGGGDHSDEAVVLRKPVEAIVKPLLEKMESHLANWLFSRLDDESFRLAGALDAATWFGANLRDLGKKLSLQFSQATRGLQQTVASLTAENGESAASEEDAFGYLQQHLHRAATASALAISRGLTAATTRVRDKLVAAGGCLRDLADQFSTSPSTDDSASQATDDDVAADQTRRKLAESLVAKEAEWVASVNKSIQQNLTDKNGGLYRCLCSDRAMRDELARTVEDATRRCISAVVSDASLLDRLLGSGETAHQRMESLLSASQTECLEHGGAACHVIASPNNAPPEAVRGRVAALENESVAVVRNPENALVACTEVHDVSLPHLAKTVIRNRRDYASFAQRVLSRRDVQWSTLMAAAMEVTPEYETQPIDS